MKILDLKRSYIVNLFSLSGVCVIAFAIFDKEIFNALIELIIFVFPQFVCIYLIFIFWICLLKYVENAMNIKVVNSVFLNNKIYNSVFYLGLFIHLIIFLTVILMLSLLYVNAKS